jgi:hypothetical protein
VELVISGEIIGTQIGLPVAARRWLPAVCLFCSSGSPGTPFFLTKRNPIYDSPKLALAREAPKNNEPGVLVVKHLRKQVANAFILYANYKHYHWQTFRPLFRDLHPLLMTSQIPCWRRRMSLPSVWEWWNKILSLTIEQCLLYHESSLPAPAKQWCRW